MSLNKKRFMTEGEYRLNFQINFNQAVAAIRSLCPESREDAEFAQKVKNYIYTLERRGINPQYVRTKTLLNCIKKKKYIENISPNK